MQKLTKIGIIKFKNKKNLTLSKNYLEIKNVEIIKRSNELIKRIKNSRSY